MTEEQLTYADALTELESIVQHIENEETDVDSLTDKVKRAAILSKFCNTKLKNTEDEVNKVLKEMENTADINSSDEDL